MAKRDKSVGGWSHDFRTIAASLLTYADLYSVSNCTKEQFLDGVRSNCSLLLELVDGFVEHSADDPHRCEGEQVLPQSVATAIESVVDAHRLSIQMLGIQLALDIDPDLPRPSRHQVVLIKRIVANLLSNAIRHSQGRSISIRATHAATSEAGVSGDRIVIEIQDQGTGITRQQLKRLMNLGEDDSSPTSAGRQRRGLLTTRQLVECMGGKLSVQSRFGRGTRFCVEFYPGETSGGTQVPSPVEADLESDGAMEAMPPIDAYAPSTQSIATSYESTVTQIHVTPSECPRVLLIDDDADLRSLMSATLFSEGFDPVAVPDEHNALEYGLATVDCVLLDLNLGSADGTEVARRFRSAGFRRPILALTAQLAEPGAVNPEPDDAFDGWIDKTEGGRAVAHHVRRYLRLDDPGAVGRYHSST